MQWVHWNNCALCPLLAVSCGDSGLALFTLSRLREWTIASSTLLFVVIIKALLSQSLPLSKEVYEYTIIVPLLLKIGAAPLHWLLWRKYTKICFPLLRAVTVYMCFFSLFLLFPAFSSKIYTFLSDCLILWLWGHCRWIDSSITLDFSDKS
jgi:hypothetical protein